MYVSKLIIVNFDVKEENVNDVCKNVLGCTTKKFSCFKAKTICILRGDQRAPGSLVLAYVTAFEATCFSREEDMRIFGFHLLTGYTKYTSNPESFNKVY